MHQTFGSFVLEKMGVTTFPGAPITEERFSEADLRERYSPAFAIKGKNDVVIVYDGHDVREFDSFEDLISATRRSAFNDNIQWVRVAPRQLFEEYLSV